MEMVTLGKTGITVNKNGFGALPIQRISIDDAVALARRAYEAGMTFFDTARFYTDSEEKLGEAFRRNERESLHCHKNGCPECGGLLERFRGFPA